MTVITVLYKGNFIYYVRLRHNVIKFALRKISLSYSRISLADICTKLNMDSVPETEYIVAKAIRDGVIEATINHEEQYLQTMVMLLNNNSNCLIFIRLMNHRMLSIGE